MNMRGSLLPLSVLVLVVALAALLSRAPAALAKVDAFRVQELRLAGAKFLSLEEASKTLAVSETASVWDDLEEWEARLRAHPIVKDVRIRRRFPKTLLLEVEEREPVAFVATPTLEPVDVSGQILPIDPCLHQLDLPLIGAWAGRDVGNLSPAERRALVREISRLAEADPELASRLSEVVLEDRGGLRAHIWEPEMDLLLQPGTPVQRIQEGLAVLGDALERFNDHRVSVLDLRFEDQVVVRLRPSAGS